MNATEPDPNVDISSPSVASFGQQPVSHQGLAQRRAECHQKPPGRGDKPTFLKQSHTIAY